MNEKWGEVEAIKAGLVDGAGMVGEETNWLRYRKQVPQMRRKALRHESVSCGAGFVDAMSHQALP